MLIGSFVVGCVLGALVHHQYIIWETERIKRKIFTTMQRQAELMKAHAAGEKLEYYRMASSAHSPN